MDGIPGVLEVIWALGLPLKGKIFSPLSAGILEGVGVTGGEVDEVAVGGGIVFSVDIFLDVAGAHEDDLFGTVDVRRVADFAGV